MSDIKHPNVLLFLGACNESSHLSIISGTKAIFSLLTCIEYLPIGSLRRYLDKDTIRWSQILKFAVSTARGMAWLHSRSPVVLHRDLHSNNILVTDNLECKVADLGLSQIQGQKYLSSTIYKRIVAPEILKGKD
jgi:serine/threonine protein kinase